MNEGNNSADTEKKGSEEARGARMQSAYGLAGDMLRAKLQRDAPEDLAYLEQVQASDVVVVTGIYDRVEQVLEALKTPFMVVNPESLDHLTLRPEQLLVINCPGQISPRAIVKVKEFVERGGSLFTTDWALKHVLEPAFPGVLAFNDRPTADTVVRIEVCTHDNPFVSGVMEAGADPQWWLEGSSYPIKVLAPDMVEVLLRSRELEEQYGEAPVAVRFKWGQGEVFHMISHYYLQRSELRTERHNMPAKAYADEMGMADSFRMMSPKEADLTLGEVESAASSLEFMERVIVEKKRRGGPQKPSAE